MKDIRDKSIVRHEDVIALNFIRDTGDHVFRRHHLNGLRSHIMEVLSSRDVVKENQGVYVNGIQRFPIARPLKMLRIFRKRFSGFEEILDEIRRFQIVRRYLTSTHLALSEEFIVDYRIGNDRDILLCGLQEYVEGECLDPWSVQKDNCLENLAEKLAERPGRGESFSKSRLIQKIEKSVESFVARVKKMIREEQCVPDLAGNRNLLVTLEGNVKLVDINNISYMSSDGCVLMDDFNYPVCDKSVEALSLIELKLLGHKIEKNDPVYISLLNPERLREVDRLAGRFHQAMRRSALSGH
ncbi:MAG: hypothetical protein MUD09_07865 [Desulfobacterales bacterium]|nr:hypothetical protein [Desulfobacterales bacterium]